jgi:hypothetical protein
VTVNLKYQLLSQSTQVPLCIGNIKFFFSEIEMVNHAENFKLFILFLCHKASSKTIKHKEPSLHAGHNSTDKGKPLAQLKQVANTLAIAYYRLCQADLDRTDMLQRLWGSKMRISGIGKNYLYWDYLDSPLRYPNPYLDYFVSVGKFNGTQNSTNSHYSDLLDKQAVS